jgi:hypothetical protein
MKDNFKLRLKVTNPNNLTAFFKKLKSIEKSVLIEITTDRVYCKVHTPDKSVIKYVEIPFTDVFEGDFNVKVKDGKASSELELLKVGILDIGKAMDMYKHFRPEEEIFWDIEFVRSGSDFVASEILIGSSNLGIKLRCADLILLSYVEDDIIKMVHSTQGAVAAFPLYKSDMGTIESLCNFEYVANELITFVASPEKVEVKGNSFNYKMNITEDEIKFKTEESVEFSFYKKQFGYIDEENSILYIQDNRVIIRSRESNSNIAISIIEN